MVFDRVTMPSLRARHRCGFATVTKRSASPNGRSLVRRSRTSNFLSTLRVGQCDGFGIVGMMNLTPSWDVGDSLNMIDIGLRALSQAVPSRLKDI